METRYARTLTLPMGEVIIESDGNAITALRFGKVEASNTCPILADCARQLTEYCAGKRTTFDLPLAPRGTEFQQTIWQLLTKIPYGQTRTYGELAAILGNPKAARAVGMACNKNPILLLIPCHRVVGSNGSLIGYAGGLDAKAWLLELERNKRHG